jgi:hypothetical protein
MTPEVAALSAIGAVVLLALAHTINRFGKNIEMDTKVLDALEDLQRAVKRIEDKK